MPKVDIDVALTRVPDLPACHHNPHVPLFGITYHVPRLQLVATQLSDSAPPVRMVKQAEYDYGL
jgi:hypothetical protein